MSHLELSHLEKAFGTTRAVHDLSLAVERGEILSILGPSGCGKTTTLRMIAGLEVPDSGAILSNSRNITNLPARERNMGMVFQNYALFPHLNVFENIAFGLKTRRLGAAAIQARVRKALTSVRMEGFETRSMHELSGGQQQRIALARALAIEPEVLLLDEPLSNLDPSLRESLRDEIRNVIRDLEMTTVFVTHDQEEAFALADRIAIMEMGICRQAGRPEEVYNNPADPFVARFLGKANLLSATCVGVEGDKCLLEIAPGVRLQYQGKAPDRTDNLMVLIRPENVLVDQSDDKNPGPSFPAVVSRVVFEGPVINYTLDPGGSVRLQARVFHRGARKVEPGSKVQVRLTDFQVMSAR